MRFLPVLTAIIVAIVLYVLLFERDIVTGGPSEQPQASDQIGDATGADAQLSTDENAVRVVGLASQAQTIDGLVRVRGKSAAFRQVDVKAEISGRVISEPIPRGTFVSDGQLLCSIDQGARGQGLIEARARLSEAQTNKNAAEQLLEDGFASETRLKNAIATLESAQAALATAEKSIEQTRILAPFEGFLESDTAELGSLMQPGALCANIIQLDPIKLVASVPEADVNKISLGADVSSVLLDGREILGHVSFVSRAADKATNTFVVEARVPNPDFSIRDGQALELLISANGTEAHFIPGSALTLNSEGVLGVRTAVDGVARFEPVNILRDTPQGVWITGPADEATIIVLGQEYVTDGVPVEVTLTEGALTDTSR